jgi:hypothetical protein
METRAPSAFQSHLTMTPFAEVALALEAIVGFNTGLDAGSQHFVTDRQPDLFAPYEHVPDYAGHLPPLRNRDRENDLINLSLRY